MKNIYDYSNIDWSLHDKIIAKQLNCHYTTVAWQRKIRGIPKTPPWPSSKPKFDFSNVDWTLNNNQIAKILKCSKYHVKRKRRLLTTIKNPKPCRTKFDWEHVDWRNKTALQIAKELHCSTRLVWFYRRKLGIHDYIKTRKNRFPYDVFVNVDWNKPNKLLAKEFNCGLKRIYYCRRRLGKRKWVKKPKYAKYDWNNMDWSKNNKFIARKTNRKLSTISQYRRIYSKISHSICHSTYLFPILKYPEMPHKIPMNKK